MIVCEDRPGYPPDGTVRAAGRRSAAAGCHPSALRRLPADGAPLRAGRVGELRLLRWYWGLKLCRPDRKDERRRFGNLAGMRQWIEAIIDTFNGQLDLERHGGCTLACVFTRVASACWPWQRACGTTGPSAPQLDVR